MNEIEIAPNSHLRIIAVYNSLLAKGVVTKKAHMAELLGCAPGTLSNAITNKEGYGGIDFINRILRTFPCVSPDYLYYGEGNPLRDGDIYDETPPKLIVDINVQKILDALNKQQQLTEEAHERVKKSQEQIDKLIDIIKEITNKQ